MKILISLVLLLFVIKASMGLAAQVQDTRPTSEPVEKNISKITARLDALFSSGKDPDEIESAGRLDIKMLGALAESNPAAETALANYAARGPDSWGEFMTLSGDAFSALTTVRAKARLRKMLAGAKSPDQQFARIVDGVKKHPEWLDYRHRSPEVLETLGLLTQKAFDLVGGRAIPLAVDVQVLSTANAKKFKDALLSYAASQGSHTAMLPGSPIIRYLEMSENPAAIPLLLRWLNGIDDLSTPEAQRFAESLIGAVQDTAKDRGALTRLTADTRPFVADYAAAALLVKYCDSTTEKTIRALIDRRVKEHAPESELQQLRRFAKDAAGTNKQEGKTHE